MSSMEIGHKGYNRFPHAQLANIYIYIINKLQDRRHNTDTDTRQLPRVYCSDDSSPPQHDYGLRQDIGNELIFPHSETLLTTSPRDRF